MSKDQEQKDVKAKDKAPEAKGDPRLLRVDGKPKYWDGVLVDMEAVLVQLGVENAKHVAVSAAENVSLVKQLFSLAERVRK